MVTAARFIGLNYPVARRGNMTEVILQPVNPQLTDSCYLCNKKYWQLRAKCVA